MAAQQYRAVTRELDSIRLMKGAIPGLSQEMADVLIRHVQLVHSAWNAQIRLPGEELGEMKRLRVRHKLAVDTMRRKCLEAAR